VFAHDHTDKTKNIFNITQTVTLYFMTPSCSVNRVTIVVERRYTGQR